MVLILALTLTKKRPSSLSSMQIKISHLFYLMEKENNELVGYIALKGQCDFVGVYNLEYFIFPKFRKKGYASEALNVLIKKSF